MEFRFDKEKYKKLKIINSFCSFLVLAGVYALSKLEFITVDEFEVLVFFALIGVIWIFRFLGLDTEVIEKQRVSLVGDMFLYEDSGSGYKIERACKEITDVKSKKILGVLIISVFFGKTEKLDLPCFKNGEKLLEHLTQCCNSI